MLRTLRDSCSRLQRTRGQTGAAAVCVHMHVSVHLRCCVYAGCSLELQCFEIKTEADSSDITEYPHDDMPSTGMFVFIDGEFRCTAFAFMFLSSCHAHQHKRCTYYVLKICLSLPLSIHPSVHKTLTTTNRFTLHPVNFPTSALICQLGCHKLS